LALALGAWGLVGRAQPLVTPPAPDVVLSTRFVTPLTYEAALTRLAAYYDDQVGRKLSVAFPEIAPHAHFEVWHDMWVFFAPAGEQTTVTLKRPTAGINSLLVKSWMLDLAGRLDAAVPLQFQKDPPLHQVEADIEASRNDVARSLAADTSLRPITTWEHAGMMVSAAPLTWIVLAPAGPRGVHHVTVAAESAAAARQLLSKLMQGILLPGIYGVYSEETELDDEVRTRASGESAAAGVSAPQAVYIANVDEKYLEGKVRAEPEMVKRSAAALGQYTIRFRLDKSYRKITISWMELTNYVHATGKFDGERALAQSVLANPRLPSPPGSTLIARTKLPALAPGAYRIRLEGENATGQAAKIDERSYWFDGKTFEEL
jgi:hypothetical protein